MIKKSITAVRRDRIAQELYVNGSVNAAELAELFDVTTETIRKDLIYLEESGIAEKSYGGAVVSKTLIERPVSIKEHENTEIKSAMAKKALQFIPENGVILLDAGSSNYFLAKRLITHQGLTIFTNSINIMSLLANSDNKIFALGGLIRGSSKATVGGWTEAQLASIQIDVAFLGTDGFKHFNGPGSANYEEYEFKSKVCSISQKTIIISESAKIEAPSQFKFCDWSDVDALVTDDDFFKKPEKEIKEIVTNTTVI